jgi:hypothetical protein
MHERVAADHERKAALADMHVVIALFALMITACYE